MATDGDLNAKGKRVENMFRNREHHLLVFLALISISTFSILLLITLSGSINSFISEVIERDTAVIGRLVMSHPELKEDIVAAFSSSLDEEYYVDGLEAAAMLGYTKDFVTDTEFLKQNRIKYIIAVILPSILIFLIFSIFVYI